MTLSCFLVISLWRWNVSNHLKDYFSSWPIRPRRLLFNGVSFHKHSHLTTVIGYYRSYVWKSNLCKSLARNVRWASVFFYSKALCNNYIYNSALLGCVELLGSSNAKITRLRAHTAISLKCINDGKWHSPSLLSSLCVLGKKVWWQKLLRFI
jgi:hypothetical protein